MKTSHALALMFCAVLGLSAVPQGDLRSRLPEDIVLTLTHRGGNVETFGRELIQMEFITQMDGSIRYLHLVLLTGEEKDTHAWYNFDNLTAVRYQFKAMSGKAKVRFRELKPFEMKNREDVLPPLQLEDFK
jgi:hypothetical protein